MLCSLSLIEGLSDYGLLKDKKKEIDIQILVSELTHHWYWLNTPSADSTWMLDLLWAIYMWDVRSSWVIYSILMSTLKRQVFFSAWVLWIVHSKTAHEFGTLLAVFTRNMSNRSSLHVRKSEVRIEWYCTCR